VKSVQLPRKIRTSPMALLATPRRGPLGMFSGPKDGVLASSQAPSEANHILSGWVAGQRTSPRKMMYPLVICYIAIENGHWNSGFSHEKWWFSIAFCMFTRGYWDSNDSPRENWEIFLEIGQTQQPSIVRPGDVNSDQDMELSCVDVDGHTHHYILLLLHWAEVSGKCCRKP